MKLYKVERTITTIVLAEDTEEALEVAGTDFYDGYSPELEAEPADLQFDATVEEVTEVTASVGALYPYRPFECREDSPRSVGEILES